MREMEMGRVFTRNGISFRLTLAATGFLLWFLFLVPPLASWSSQYEFVQAAQFCCFAMITPALVVLGRPWRWLGLASGEPLQIGNDGELVAPVRLRSFDRVALQRMKRLGSQRIILWLIIFMAQAIVWRLSPVVNGLAHHSWLTIIESFTLIGVGVLLWLELVASTPLSPTSTRPYRIGVAAVAMWTVWVITYVEAMSHSSWTPVLHPGAVLVLSKAADQQFASAVMCLFSALVFVPLFFSNLLAWLYAEENPNEELSHLVRVEHARGFFGPKF